MAGNAGNVSDVPAATQPAAAEGAGPTGVEGEVAPPESPSPPADHADDTDSDDAGENDEDEVRNPELKKLHDEAVLYRTSAKAEKERADNAAEALRAARIENAFLHAAIGQVNDTDAAFKLADTTDVIVDEGNVANVDAVVVKVVERYPYLRPEVADDDLIHGEPVPQTQPSGRQTNGPRKYDQSGSRAVLESKYQALRGRA
jgi:hypothetical protein